MIDRLARIASEDLRTATSADVESGLRDVYAAHSRHRRVTRLAAAAAVLAALGTGWWGGQALTGTRSDGPTTPVLPTPTRSAVCADSRVTCLGGRRYQFDLDHPVHWRIPRGFGVNSGTGTTSFEVESYTRSGSAGVTVMEHVTAASQKTPTSPAPGFPATAAGFTAWLASRPYFDATVPRSTTLAGHDAWQVRLTRQGGATVGPARCLGNTTPCRAVTSDPTVTGVWGDMVADYTAIDLPGGGTTVVWSWAFGNDARAALARNRELVRGISWPR